MKKGLLKKIFITTGSVFLGLVLVLAVHIYIVTRPKPMDAKIIAMARIDFKQNITQDDAGKVTAWLYQQKGIDHVLCNAVGKTVIFTFHPLATNANLITSNFKTAFDYKADRYIPTEKEMKSGCPVAATSWTYKVYHMFRSI